MALFKLVSLDVFGTLVDLRNIQASFWKAALGTRFSVSALERLNARGDEVFFRTLINTLSSVPDFVSTRSIFERCFEEICPEFGLSLSPAETAQLYIDCHIASPLFSDAAQFLESVGKEYALCLSCDADNDMLETARQLHSFDFIFTSEDLKAYKLAADGSFFRKVVQHCGTSPSQILHIGDSRKEIVSAKQAGLAACWIDRTSQTWTHAVKPDYQVHSLVEAAEILGMNSTDE